MTDPAGAHTEPDPEAQKKAYSSALNLLAIRDRSRAEIADRLAGRFAAPVVEQVVDRLCDDGYLNDGKLAARLAEAFLETKNFAPRRVRYELARRGLTAESATSALEHINDHERIRKAAVRAARACLKGWDGPADAKTERRLVGYLSRRGFMDATIRDMVHLARRGTLWHEPDV